MVRRRTVGRPERPRWKVRRTSERGKKSWGKSKGDGWVGNFLATNKEEACGMESRKTERGLELGYGREIEKGTGLTTACMR